MSDVVAGGAKSMEELVSLCKRRGFIFPASEIYGGLNGFWDYGPLGAQLKKNLADRWWRDMTLTPPVRDGKPVSIVGVDSSIIQNPRVWEASGHVGGFSDPMVDCKESKQRYRADKIFLVGFFSLDQAKELYASLEDAVALLEKAPDASLEERAEIQRLFQTWRAEYSQRAANLGLPAIIVSEQGDSAEEAVAAAQRRLSKRQLKHLGVNFTPPGWAHPLVSAPEKWPRLSPATQTESLTAPRDFNLMFQTYVGATASEDDKAYLRPETAQGIFLNFANIVDTTRVRVPFGIAQIGKAFRNEVTPRNFIFRSREFEQMEMEFFCHKDEARGWLDFWVEERRRWWMGVGLSEANMIVRKHDDDELAHYAKAGAGTYDIEYRWPFTHPGFGELEGVAHRGNFDLSQHEQHSGKKIAYFDQERNERYLPDVIEPAAGLTRGVLALLCEAFTPDESRASKVVMKFHPSMAPIKAAVYPLVNKDGMPEVGEKLVGDLRRRFGHLGLIEYDAKQSIGKRYARMDEAGCPVCFTIDGQTLEDQTVTCRDRDTLAQERISLDRVVDWLGEKIGG
ncbi:MAG: glycine--tRNA ligase [Phycisphaeraceae bacterium]|nr:glycine--tRNA ligase [Phycisphaeraceae bacterium]